MNTQTLHAITPLFLASIGGVITIGMLFSPKLSDTQWTAGLGVASTAIAGAAGLAQTSTKEDKSQN
ncbi:hypothetical protein G7B40_001715 [Aetokthonos hydrillicola Thurmond2011]|jgi:hypothetical protein|uniref:Uncharacterized protein n=1 Tax=Aetokthonos hydrillicola Thurmond2011 TaxID=2712845 RepID=A0AAP5I3W5_9CYAN|nr:hypothetical protein [Aetokthonos hydrillicola]MBO3462960.1 hypothetical protein [Aetokthonos hydrillicola CCALA 1050]MBW4591256.1 hypothetical protein [Aetokthonos hydrillicola CCALA 1050]MDR9893304.1 hypothetical protein [Aetokthonos hydrillicola Thurmond2011]